MSIGVRRYRFIYVARNLERDSHAGKPIYYIFNRKSNTAIGRLLWYPRWKRWIAQFDPESVWSADCLADVGNAIEHVTAAPEEHPSC